MYRRRRIVDDDIDLQEKKKIEKALERAGFEARSHEVKGAGVWAFDPSIEKRYSLGRVIYDETTGEYIARGDREPYFRSTDLEEVVNHFRQEFPKGSSSGDDDDEPVLDPKKIKKLAKKYDLTYEVEDADDDVKVYLSLNGEEVAYISCYGGDVDIVENGQIIFDRSVESEDEAFEVIFQYV
jgi:hypothetical protein